LGLFSQGGIIGGAEFEPELIADRHPPKGCDIENRKIARAPVPRYLMKLGICATHEEARAVR